MVFDDEQKRRDTGESIAEDESRKDDRRSSAGRAAASAGAGGAGLGAGAAAGIVAGDDVVEFVRDRAGDAADASMDDIEEARARVAAAEDAARAASFDVFESRVAEVGEELPAGITEAASIVGDALPPVPGGQEDAQQPVIDAPGGQPPIGRPDPDDIVPIDGEAPEPGSPPSEGEPPAAPDIDGGPVDEGEDAPPPPSGAAPDFPAPPAAPDGPAPPSAPSPPAPGGNFGEDEVVDEAPAPPAGPAPSGSSDDGAAVAPPAAEAPAPAGPGTSNDVPAAPPVSDAPGFSEDVDPPITDRPDVPEGSTSSDSGASSSDGPSGEPAPPVASEPDAPSTPDTPAGPGGSTEAPPAPGGSGSSSAGGDQAPSPPGEPGSSTPDSDPGQSVDYPYVYRWDDDGDWVDVAMQNDHGEVYYLRYYDDGSVFYLNEHGHYQQIEGDNLPQLLYVGDDGVAYFSKMQHHHTVYFSMDPHGNVEWVDYDDIPGYEPPVYDDDYEYPRVAEYEYGDEPWALVEMEDGRLIKYYQDGGAYLVDEHGNETAISGFQIPSLLYVDHDGDAYFRVFLENEGVYRYYTIDVDGGVEYIHAEDVPGYEEEEPVYDEHPPYFFDDYPNPFYGDLEPDGEPSFANGVYTQSYNDGQVVVTWFQEGGPYRIRYYSEDNAGGDLLLDLTYDAYNYEIDEVHYLYEEDGVEDELYPPYGMPPSLGFGDREYLDPEDAGYELISATPEDDPTQWQYIGPNGERVIVNKTDEYTYQFVYQPDPNATPGQWEMVMNVTTDEYGNYVSHEAVDGTYYDEWYEDNQPVEDDYEAILPANAPAYFEHNGETFPNPEHDDSFHFVGNPTPNTYRYENDEGYTIIIGRQPDGSYNILWGDLEANDQWDLGVNLAPDGGYEILHYHGEQYENGEHYVPPVEEEPVYDTEYVYGLLPDNLPAEFEGGFLNPEHSDEFTYSHSRFTEPDSAVSPVHFLTNNDGSSTIVVVENSNGTVSMYWYDRPVGEFGLTDLNDLEAHAFIQQDGQYDVHYYEDGVEVEAPVEEEGVAEPGAEDAIFDAIPDNLPAFFEEERFPNPEGSDDYHYHSSDGDVHYFVSEDGNSTIRVWTNPNGNVTMAWHEAPPEEINASTQELVVEIQANGDWETTYYSDGPAPVDEPEFEADGYLPEGAPDYFGEESWVNPEADERFEFFLEGHPEPGVVTRTYRADLDDDGSYDYQIVVIERADGSISVDYRNMDTGEIEARVNVTQDAYGNYGGYFELHQYVDDPQGAPPYEEPVEEPEDDYLPDWLPESFDGWPSPVQEGFEYQYTGTGDGNQNHFYSNGEYTIMVTDYGDGTGRVLIDDLSNGQGWDMGYDLYDYGQYDVMDAYVPEPEEVAPEEDYLPDWLPNDFDGWPSPTQEGFEYQYSGSGDGNQNHFYSNGQYTIMVTDYGDGTGRVLIDDLSNGQGWDTGYDLYDYGQYSVMDAYVPEEPEPEPEDEYLPDWLPESFDGWPSPVQEGFEYQYTGTGGGNQNHFYSNGQYTIMVTDYGDGTGRVLIDDLSNGQGWDTGYDLYDYGQYQVMDDYAPEQMQAAFDQVEEVDPVRSVAPEDLEEIPEEPEPVPDPAPVVQEAVSEQEVEEIEAAGGNAELVAEEEALEFTETVEEAPVTEAVEESLTFDGPAPETVAEEVALDEPPAEAVAEFQVAQPEIVGTEQAEVAQVPAEEEFAENLEDLEDDGTGF